MAPPIKVRGAGRSKGIPSGYLMGRSSAGNGDVELLNLNAVRRMGVASHADVNAVKTTIAFLGLTDTPKTYAGDALFLVRVNAAATGLEFVSPTSAVVPFLPLSNGDTVPLLLFGNGQTVAVPVSVTRMDTRVENFAAVGTLANRPAAPVVPPGGLSCYLASDTSKFFVWDAAGATWHQTN